MVIAIIVNIISFSNKKKEKRERGILRCLPPPSLSTASDQTTLEGKWRGKRGSQDPHAISMALFLGDFVRLAAVVGGELHTCIDDYELLYNGKMCGSNTIDTWFWRRFIP